MCVSDTLGPIPGSHLPSWPLTYLLPLQFDRLWGEMPVNAKGRLKYLDFLNRFSSELVSTPATTGDSTGAQRGSSVPESWEGTKVAASSPTRDLRTGLRSQCHSGVSPHPRPDPQTTYL